MTSGPLTARFNFQSREPVSSAMNLWPISRFVQTEKFCWEMAIKMDSKCHIVTKWPFNTNYANYFAYLLASNVHPEEFSSRSSFQLEEEIGGEAQSALLDMADS